MPNLSRLASPICLQLSAPVGRSYMAWNENTKDVSQMSSFRYLLLLSAPVGRTYMACNENTKERSPNVVIHISAANICSCAPVGVIVP